MKAKKSKQANLERLRFPLLLIGLTFAGALVLSAFEWRSFDEERNAGFDDEVVYNSLPDEAVFVAIPEKKAQPNKPQVKRPVIDEFIITKTEPRVDIELFVPDFEDDPIVQEISSPVEVVDEEEVLFGADVMPSFPGGVSAMYAFLGEKINYPSMAKDSGIQGVVHVNFVVSKDGTIRDVKILRGIGAGCDEEVLRVLSLMPKWEPGKQKGLPVNVSYTLPVSYILQ